MELLVRLEQSSFSMWVRESRSLFAYPGILLLHTYGMALLVGIAAAIDLRILGFAPALPLSAIGKFLPILWAAFWVNAATGTILLVADATSKMTNPDFFVKMGFIALAVVNQRTIQNQVFGDARVDEQPFSRKAKMLAATSLALWLGAITTGRLLAYVGTVSG
jgi:hypothetical protein